MKNSTCILVACLFLSTLVSAKNGNEQSNNPKIKKLSGSALTGNHSLSAFFTEDFAGGLPAGWQVNDNAGNGVIWKHTMMGSNSGTSLDSNGTTANNGYMIVDSDSSGGVGGENTDLTSPVIDCTGRNGVHLKFNELNRYFNDTATVQVSTDGLSWTIVHNSSDGLSQHASTANPNAVDIDISSIAANQDTLYIRFNYKADYSYYWMIDDVELHDVASMDAAVTEIIGPVTSCINLSSTESVTINIMNAGSAPITTGLTATYIADGGAPVTEPVTATIPPGASFPFTFAATVDFSVPGNHTLVGSVTLTGDTNTSNDGLSSTVFNGPHVVDVANNYANGFEPGQDLSGWLTEDGNSDQITWEYSTLLPHNGTMCAKINAAQADDWLFTTCLELDASLSYFLRYYVRTSTSSTQADYEVLLGASQSSIDMTQQIVNLGRITNLTYNYVNAPFTVASSGTYYFGFHVYNGDSAVGIHIDNVVVTTDSVVGIRNAAGMDFNVYPNPSTGVFHISGENLSGGMIEVLNNVGQLVKSMQVSGMKNHDINLSGYPDGIYVLRIITDEGVATRLLSKN